MKYKVHEFNKTRQLKPGTDEYEFMERRIMGMGHDRIQDYLRQIEKLAEGLGKNTNVSHTDMKLLNGMIKKLQDKY